VCSHDVRPEVEELLAGILRDIAAALSPEDPDAVVIGPVDFGDALAALGGAT
jgi:hypothetical protein